MAEPTSMAEAYAAFVPSTLTEDPILEDIETLNDAGLPRHYDRPHDDVATMTEHNLRGEVRRLRAQLDARDLERATFVRHIARQRESETDIEARVAGPLRAAETRLKTAETRIENYRETIATLQRERAHFKVRYESLARSRKDD